MVAKGEDDFVGGSDFTTAGDSLCSRVLIFGLRTSTFLFYLFYVIHLLVIPLREKTKNFLMFSRGIERYKWHEMG